MKGDFHCSTGASTVGGVGLLDVDPPEVGIFGMLCVEFLQAPGLSHEGASGVGTEDEDGDFLGFGEVYFFLIGEGDGGHFWDRVANFWGVVDAVALGQERVNAGEREGEEK